MTQLTPDALMEIGACSREEPHPNFLLATIISPTCTFFTKSLSISSIQCVASSFGSEEFKYLAGMITSVSTLSPYLNTLPCAAFISYLTSFFSGIFYITSAGPEIFPVMALAAATAGLARYTSESTCPIRPTKLRFVVDTQRSPSASTPIYPPRHGPQVGVLTIAPASIKILRSPSSMASR